MRHLCRRAASVAVAAGLLTLASPAVAAAPSYKGKVKDGGAITFQVSGGAVRHLNANASVSCVSLVAPSLSGIDIYIVSPPKAAHVGRAGAFTATVNAKRQKLFLKGKWVDTLYNVKATVKGTVKGRNATGTVHVTYSKDRSIGPAQIAILSCSVKTSWSAKRR